MLLQALTRSRWINLRRCLLEPHAAQLFVFTMRYSDVNHGCVWLLRIQSPLLMPRPPEQLSGSGRGQDVFMWQDGRYPLSGGRTIPVAKLQLRFGPLCRRLQLAEETARPTGIAGGSGVVDAVPVIQAACRMSRPTLWRPGANAWCNTTAASWQYACNSERSRCNTGLPSLTVCMHAR